MSQRPIKGERNLLITSALPYVNNVPHLGNLIGCVLSADVYARFGRLRGYNVLYVCGTDEYGTATEAKALAEGLSPREICDKYHKLHAQCYEWFDISFDIFGRTSTETQTEIAQDIFLKNVRNGFVREDDVEQLFCPKCQRYLADRFVLGTCPDCGYDDARGDQCDRCGHLLNAVDLISPKCAIEGSEPVRKTTRHLFLDLPLHEQALHEFIEAQSESGLWSSNSLNVSRSWLKSGLKARCITRDLNWGTSVPMDGFEDKVFYVWFDAPIGYISITAGANKDWALWWKAGEGDVEVELCQFMGKDNIPFHTIIFPSSLMGAQDNYTMLHRISTTEYLNYETGKFSKSKNVGVFGDTVQSSGIPVEVWRYYLLANRPEQSDTVFMWDDFQAKCNDELLKNLGNFVNRALKFCSKEFSGTVCEVDVDTDKQLIGEISEKVQEYITSLEQVKIKNALKTAMSVSSLGNQYIQHNKPWELLEGNRERAHQVISLAVNVAHLLAVLFEPFMPSFSNKLLEQLELSRDSLSLASEEFICQVPAGHTIGTPVPLFDKIDNDQIKTLRALYSGSEDAHQSKHVQTFPLSLVVGQVVKCEIHPTAEHLLVLSVNVGESSERIIVSGLAQHYSCEKLLGQFVVVVTNLKASNFRGVKSFGMILCGNSPDKQSVQVLSPLSSDVSLVGKNVLAEGEITGNDFKPALLNSKKLNTVLGKLALTIGDDDHLGYTGEQKLQVVGTSVSVGCSSLPKGSNIQ